MAELSTLARPYARAAFEYARDAGDMPSWSSQLAMAAAVASDAQVSLVLNDPALTAEQQAQALIQVCGEELGAHAANFINILASNKRLPLLPEISALFEQYKANQEKSVDVEVRTAFELGDATRDKLAEVLKVKLERDIKVETVVDTGLVGGVLIRAGDLVIDGSVRGRLNKLSEAMNS